MRYLMRNAVEWVVQVGLVLTFALVQLALRDALRRQRVRDTDPKAQSASGRKHWLRQSFWVR
jgi:hypothetical protein